MDNTILINSTFFFLAGFVYSAMALKSGRHRSSGINLLVMGLGFVFQSWFLYQLGQERGRCPITNEFDLLIFVSWSMVLFYFLLGPPFRVSLLGVFTAPLAFLFQVVALVLPASMSSSEKADPAMIDPWGETHAALALMSYGAFALAFVAGLMYLVLDRKLKKRDLHVLFYNLPPINLLGKSLHRLLIIGLVLLTLGIATAFGMEKQPSIEHLSMTLAVWVIYGVILLAQLVRGLGFRRMAVGAVWAFAVPLLTLWLLSHH